MHVIGKGITRFHAVYWPAFLLSAGLPLPKTLFVHGYITVDGQKMSKSLGNVVDPLKLAEKYGADAVRYFFLREIPATEDGDYSHEKFETRYNADLANGLGNLVARLLTLQGRSFKTSSLHIQEKSLSDSIAVLKERYDKLFEEFRFNEILEQIWALISLCDKYIEREKPWEKKEGWEDVWRDLIIGLYEISEFLEPFLPDTKKEIGKQLGSAPKIGSQWMFTPQRGKPLFPRIET